MEEVKQKILVVEDDKLIVKILVRILKKNNYEPLTAYNGLEAFESLKSGAVPDMIICDIMMPKMDGLLFRKKMIEYEEFKMIPFIFVTAKSNTKDKIIGLELGVDDYITKPFAPEEVVARVKAILNRYEQYNQLIRFDGLTQLFNRRTVEFKLLNELNRVKRYDVLSSILLIDLDHFKNINDTFGHRFGDKVLVEISKEILRQLREVDFAGRIGGEEFLIVMPETNKADAFQVSERLRKAVSHIVFSGYDCQITISGGLVSAPLDGVEMDRLLKKADSALYLAKNAGRNRIVKVEDE
jgi:diguanylate cyclase (GGDEF)-like protein